ncbi:MAG: hypothetical protein JRJ12_13120 [Deltaproteobacteria bacterium]|nr:hypothetical protein [Deltaproteobacteria bacterium]
MVVVLFSGNNRIAFGEWISFAPVTSDTVSQASIASDGTNLLVFYRYPNVSLNLDEGVIKKWSGNSWEVVAHPTNQCHNPDIAVAGNLIAACWHTDIHDLGFGTNANGTWVSTTWSQLQHQWGATVAVAKGRAYVTYACRYSDGTPSAYMMLHVKSPIGTSGTQLELDGGWREPFADVGEDPAITGDANYWYVVSTQNGWLSVQRDYDYLGDFFRYGSDASDPEIVLYQGSPVVAWEENSGAELYIAGWNGAEWHIIGADSIASGYFDSLRIAAAGTKLYAVYTRSTGSPRIDVSRWNGSEWATLADPSESTSSTISTVDIAVYEGNPVVAFVEDNTLKVKKYILTPAAHLPGIELLLLDD